MNHRLTPHRRLVPLLTCLALPAVGPASLANQTDLDVMGGITAVYQHELATEAQDASISGDLRLTLPAGSGTWIMYLEAASGTDANSIFDTYPEINADAGTVFDRNGNGHIQLSELHYRVDFGERSELVFGQIDPAALIDRSRIANDENTQFLGAGFVNNLTINFPDYTFGALYRKRASGSRPEFSLMLTNADGIADNPTRSYSELLDFSGGGNGLFAAGAARWYRGDTEIETGLWLRTDEREHLDDPTRKSRNYGLYAVYDRLFGEQAITLRGGIANENVSRATRFASLAWRRIFARGTLGVGYARILESSRARRITSGDTDHAELWFRLPLGTAALHGTLSLQYVANPGFDRSSVSAQANALLAGLRIDYAF